MHLLSDTEIKISNIPLKKNGECYLDFHIPSDRLVFFSELLGAKVESAEFIV